MRAALPATFGRLVPALASLVALAAATGGCWYHVEDYCPRCAIVDHDHSAVPPTAPGTKTEVVLVHGSFGFGPEWGPVVDAVRQSPGFDLVAWKWPGPFRTPKRDALALRAEIQSLLDGLPLQVDEVIVLAHSAGGLIANLAIRGLDVKAGRHVTVALLDPAFWGPPLGKREEYTPLPPGSRRRCSSQRIRPAPRPARRRSRRPAPPTEWISPTNTSARSGTTRWSPKPPSRSWRRDETRSRPPRTRSRQVLERRYFTA